MGKTFRYVEDGVLSPCGGVQCHLCEQTGVPIYCYGGRIVDATKAKNTELARTDPNIDELCGECIVGGNVRKRDGSIREIMPTIQEFAAEPAAMVEEYHRLPDLPFFQGDVWPMCCGEFAEYVGSHPPLGTHYSDYEQWKPQNAFMDRFKLADFYPLDKLPVLHTMALFRCLHCPRRFWAFQYSGLFWRGPLSD